MSVGSLLIQFKPVLHLEVIISLYPNIVRSGTQLACGSYGHVHLASAEWLAAIREKSFPKRIHNVLYQEDVRRLRCSVCGAKGPKVIDKPIIPQPAVADDVTPSSWGDIPYYPDWRDQV